MSQNIENKEISFFGYKAIGLSFRLAMLIKEALRLLFISYFEVSWCKELVQAFNNEESVISFIQDFQDVAPSYSFIEVDFTNYDLLEQKKREERLERIGEWVRQFGLLNVKEIEDYCALFSLESSDALQRNVKRNISLSNSPNQIFQLLSNDVIGQDNAKKALAVELFNHSIRKQASLSFIDEEIIFPKSNVLLVGPSGSGKTFLARKCAEILDVPFIKIDAASAVKSGIVGNSIMDHFQSYYCSSEDKKKLEYSIVLIDEFDKLATHYAYDRTAIQNELLNLIGENGEASFEPSRNTPKVKLNCSIMLFILCGAFQDLHDKNSSSLKIGFQVDSSKVENNTIDRSSIKQFGFSTEIMNRIHKIVRLEKLSENEIFELLKDSDSSPLVPYKNVFTKLGKQVEFTDCFYNCLASKVCESEQNGRGPAAILSQVMEDVIYQITNLEQNLIIDKTYLN